MTSNFRNFSFVEINKTIKEYVGDSISYSVSRYSVFLFSKCYTNAAIFRKYDLNVFNEESVLVKTQHRIYLVVIIRPSKEIKVIYEQNTPKSFYVNK